MKLTTRQKSGITLLSLVITIIVLFILAGVTVATLINKEILKYAEKSNYMSEESKFREDIELEVANYNIEAIQNDILAKQMLYNNLINKGYYIFDVQGNEIKDTNELNDINEIVVKFKEWTENINFKIGKMKKIDYIESSSTQYIDTGVYPSNTTGIEIEFSAMEYVNKEVANQYTCFIFGGEDAWQKKSFDYQAGLYGLVYNTTKVGTVYNTETLSDRNNDKHILRLVNQQFYFDGEFQYDLSQIDNGIWQSSSTLILFGIKRNNVIQRLDSSKIYSCKVYEGNNVIRDFIPVIDSNNVACLYEKIEGKFYYNLGTGNFKTNLDE